MADDTTQQQLANHEKWIRQLWSAVLSIQGQLPGADASRRHGGISAGMRGGIYSVHSMLGVALGEKARVTQHARGRVGVKTGGMSSVFFHPHYPVAAHAGVKLGSHSSVAINRHYIFHDSPGVKLGTNSSPVYIPHNRPNTNVGVEKGPVSSVTYGLLPFGSVGLEKGVMSTVSYQLANHYMIGTFTGALKQGSESETYIP